MLHTFFFVVYLFVVVWASEIQYYKLYQEHFCRYEGNVHLKRAGKNKAHHRLILAVSVGVLAVLFVLFVGSLLLLHYIRRKTSKQKSENKGKISHNNIAE